MQPTKVYYSIAEVRQLTELPVATLRYWEQQFAQLSPYKDEHGNRYYTEKDIALIKQIKKHLSDGKIVNLDALGSFQFQISGKGALTEEDYNTNLIQKVRIQYRPGRLIREVQNLSTLHFRKVEPLKKKTTEDPENNEGFEE